MFKPPVKLMSTLGVLAPLKEIVIPAFEDTAGIAVETSFSPTTVLNEQIAGGVRGHVLVAISDAVATLAAKGIVDGGSIARLASTSVGLAKMPGTPAVDISTREALIDTLLAARSVVISQTGASGIFFRDLVGRLGIAERVLDKAKTIPQGLTAELLLTGEADLAVQQVSELKAVAGVDVIGPLPTELNHTTTFTAALFREAATLRGPVSLLECITGPLARRAYDAGGLVVSDALGSSSQ